MNNTMKLKDVSQRGQVTGRLSPFLETLRLKKVARHIGPGAMVLDVGCGRAKVLNWIPAPNRYIGVDTLAEVITENKRRMPFTDFFVVDVEKDELPGEAGLFNIIVMAAVLEHFHDPENTLRRLKSRLLNGGKIILTTPSPKGKVIMKVGVWSGILSREADEEHGSLYSRADIERIAAAAGYRVVFFETFLLGLNQLAVLSVHAV